MNHALAGLLAFLLATGSTTVVLQTAGPAEGEVVALGATVRPDAAPATLSATRAAEGVDAPTWREGYAWIALFGQGEWPCRIVVVDADADGYEQGFACDGDEREAARLAAFPQRYVGLFTRDLEGVGEGAPARWFDWPLTDGKTWEMEWGDEVLDVTATFVPDIEGPLGDEPGYVMRAAPEGDSDEILVWNYVPSIGWWSHLEFLESGWAVNVVEFEKGWDGTAVTARAEEILDVEPLNGAHAPVSPQGVFSVDEDADLLVMYGTGFGAHDERVELIAPDGDAAVSRDHRSFSGSSFFFEFPDAEPGTWELRLTGYAMGDVRYRVWAAELVEHRV